MSRGPGTVYLVGAGPGDPGLLTRRGETVLSRADVVVYDHLASARLLDLAPAHAVLIRARLARYGLRGPVRPAGIPPTGASPKATFGQQHRLWRNSGPMSE